MSVRIKCQRCDAMILEVTASVNNGLCGHCKSDRDKADFDAVVQGWIEDPSTLPGTHGNPEPQGIALKIAAGQIRSRLYPAEEDRMEQVCRRFFDSAYTKWTFQGSSPLSDMERHCLAVETFYGEVLNGGLTQYLGNESGAFAQWADQAFEAIGIPAYAEVMRKVKELFPGGLVPEDRDERWDLVESMDPNRLEAMEEPFWNRYRDHKGEIRDLLYAYLKDEPLR